MRIGLVRRHAPSLALFGVVLLVWQLAGSVFRVREYLLPGPLGVVRAALNFSIPWSTHIWITTLEVLGGFLLAGTAGVVLGVAVAWSETIARALVPFLVFVNTLPKVAVAPRPGQVARTFTVPLPRPRTVETRVATGFGRLSLEIYRMLTELRA